MFERLGSGNIRALEVTVAMDREMAPNRCPACPSQTRPQFLSGASKAADVNYHACPDCFHIWATSKDNKVRRPLTAERGAAKVQSQRPSMASDIPRAQTIVRQVAGSGGVERFCILHEAPLTTANAFLFTCAGGTCSAQGVTIVEACNLLVAAGISEPDVYRLLEEARAGYRPDVAQV